MPEERMPEHAAVITALIPDRPMCPDRIAAKANLTVDAVTVYLTRIATAVTVQTRPDERCHACGRIGPAVSIGRE